MKRASLLAALVLTLSIPAAAADIPPTLEHPRVDAENGYYFGVIDRNTKTLLWRAPYHHELLYQLNTGWLNGDRLAYHCMYGFIQQDGVIVGRFTVRAIPTADNNSDGAYIQINDSYMEDAPGSPQDTAGGPARRYDGSVRDPNIQSPFADCPQDVGIDYQPGTADERPIIPFWNNGEVIELRDYRNTVAAPGVTFEELEPITTPFQVTTGNGTHTVNDRRTVLARLNGLPVAVVYYDGLGTGSVVGPAAEGSNPDDCNAIISMSQGAQVYSGSQAGASDPNPSELEALTGEQWMLLFKGGAPLKMWKSQTLWASLGERHRCGTDAEIDRVLFIFDPRGSVAPFTNDLNVVVGILESRYPNAEIDVSLLVGGDGHAVCTVVQAGQTQNVTASVTHRNSIGAMTMPNAGPDLDVPCSGYADKLGHLKDSAAADAQAQVAAFYNGG